MEDREDAFAPDAEALFVEFAARGETDFEGLVARHPARAEELRRLRSEWRLAEEALGAARAETRDARRAVEELASEVVARLADRVRSIERYERGSEIGRGSMGLVHAVLDRDLRRTLAMKTIRRREDRPGQADSTRTLDRFLEEAQITAQLDHPGIPAVHELGLDEEGGLYFTMKLVKGETLTRVLERARAGEGEWPLARVLAVLQRVCEAMAYAHDKGVVHRDLKPSNVMVGRFGEVYVLDWGLAHVLGTEHRRDIRLRPGDTAELTSERRDRRRKQPDSPLVTNDGDVVGTPAYMPPEQAVGILSLVDQRSDVYSVGAMLYQALSGKHPYADAGDFTAIWQRVRDEAPRPVAELAPDAAPELVAVCEKAMARERSQRYADMGELARDLRLYLEGRVVPAHRTGVLIELRKWVARNRAATAGIAVAAGLVLGATLYGVHQERALLAAEVARAEERAEQERALREAELGRVVESVVVEGRRGWRVHPDSVPAIEAWLARAEELVRELEPLHAERAALAQLGTAVTDPDAGWIPDRFATRREELRQFEQALAEDQERLLSPETSEHDRALASISVGILEEQIGALQRLIRLDEQRGPRSPELTFGDPELAERYARASELADARDELRDAAAGLIRRAEGTLAAIGEVERTATSASVDRWRAAIASIADPAQCPLYRGLVVEPQLGLVPLRRDPRSGLWEFLHVTSGAQPGVRPDGAYQVAAETGIVLVLIPGGEFVMGARGNDPRASQRELPAHAVRLAPFFLSKYELTQGQWTRAADGNPSEFRAGYEFLDTPRLSLSHPVENVSFAEVARVLESWCLELPTEAQWELACRGGTETIYWWGDEWQHGLVNGADARHSLAVKRQVEGDDGYPFHAPVDAFAPNPFGLYSILGNVEELCRAGWRPDYVPAPGETELHREGDGLLRVRYSTGDVVRGGGHASVPEYLRCSTRFRFALASRAGQVGCRPCRPLDPPSSSVRDVRVQPLEEGDKR